MSHLFSAWCSRHLSQAFSIPGSLFYCVVDLRLGDLLCCEMCPAVYHLGCVVPPLEEVPENDWLCSVCRAHQVGHLFGEVV